LQAAGEYRAPLVLRYLEGKSNDGAALALGWPRGSMSKRLARGLDMLSERLRGRGVPCRWAGCWARLTASTASASLPQPC